MIQNSQDLHFFINVLHVLAS
jgi:hypothetical protein